MGAIMSMHVASAAKIALIWTTALVCGWLSRRCVPRELYLHFWLMVYPARSVAFWLCLLAASIVTIVFLVRLPSN